MRILFWGTPEFATAPLRALLGEGFDVVGVVTQPDRPRGRGRSQLDASPVKTRLTHPRTGVAEDVTIDGEFLANVIFGALYNPLTSSLLPELIARAERHDFQAMLALAMAGGGEGTISMGMQLSVVCAEDYPRITPEQAAHAAENTIFSTHLMTARMKACEFWPRGHVDASYYEPVKSDVPVLVLSGGLAYILGALVYGFKRPDPSPTVFGFHEVFHAFTVVAFAAQWVGVLIVALDPVR